MAARDAQIEERRWRIVTGFDLNENREREHHVHFAAKCWNENHLIYVWLNSFNYMCFDKPHIVNQFPWHTKYAHSIHAYFQFSNALYPSLLLDVRWQMLLDSRAVYCFLRMKSSGMGTLMQHQRVASNHDKLPAISPRTIVSFAIDFVWTAQALRINMHYVGASTVQKTRAVKK